MKRNFNKLSIPGALLVIFLVSGCVNSAFADGGRLRFRQSAGPFIVTLFTTPDPLTTGRADFSVAVERAGVPGLVEDAHVDFVLTRADGHGKQLILHASHGAATSKWLQAANFSIPARGLWHVTVVVKRGQQMGRCSGQVQVGAARTRHLEWDVLPVPLIAILFVLHEIRKRKYKRDRHNRLLAVASHTRSKLVQLERRM